MPLRPSRVGRVGVVGSPVAKAVVVGHAMGPGPSPVAKAAVVGAAVSPGPSPSPRPPSSAPSSRRVAAASEFRPGSARRGTNRTPSASRFGSFRVRGRQRPERRQARRSAAECRPDRLQHRALGRAGPAALCLGDRLRYAQDELPIAVELVGRLRGQRRKTRLKPRHRLGPHLVGPGGQAEARAMGLRELADAARSIRPPAGLGGTWSSPRPHRTCR